MAFTSPPPAPQRKDRATFSLRLDAFLSWLVGFAAQMNLFISSLTAMAAGGSNTFTYTFDPATNDSDPGAGKLRFGSTTQSGAVVIRLDSTAASGGDITNFLASLQSGTSNIKGSIRVQKLGDPSIWLLFNITSITTMAADGTPTYSNLTVVPIGSSSISPFLASDTLIVYITAKGDKGDSGGTPSQAEMLAAVGTLPVANGGTGATTASQARENLGVKPIGIEPIAAGGTGANNADGALRNLNAFPRYGGQLDGSITLPDGNQSRPVISFIGDTDTGFYHIGDGVIGIACNGILVARITQNGVEAIRITQTPL